MVFEVINSYKRSEYAISEDKIILLKNPGAPAPVTDALTELLREGAQRMLAAASEAEVAAFLERFKDEKTADGRQRVVRNGHLPTRSIQTGVGAVEATVPRVRDRAKTIQFTSAILPPYLRRTKSLEELLPWLYLKGISTGDFQEALTALLGREAPGLSASTISRLKETWKDEHLRWSRRDLSTRRYVYLWVDGIHFGVRLDDAAQCILVVIGATADGRKELLALADGYREREDSWRELLLELKSRGLKIDPHRAIGDGALGFWKALPQVFGTTLRQRCWVHKTANVLNKLPKSQQPRAKAALHETGWRPPDRRRRKRSITSSRCIGPSIPRRWRAWKRTGRRCWRSTIFRRSIGFTLGPPIRSNPPLLRCGSEPPKTAAVCPGRASSPWSSCG